MVEKFETREVSRMILATGMKRVRKQKDRLKTMWFENVNENLRKLQIIHW